MKKYVKRILAMVLALSLLMAVCVTAGAATKKSPKTKVRSAAGVVYKDGFGIRYTWKKVSGATGYEYCYNLNSTSDVSKADYTFVTTDKTSVEIKLSPYKTVDFRVRAFTELGGTRIYGPWAKYKLKQSKVDSLLVKAVKKRMKTNDLFEKAAATSVTVRRKAGTKYEAVSKMNKGDEFRATGSFKRDKSGIFWIQVYAGVSQNQFVKGWVPSDEVTEVWY